MHNMENANGTLAGLLEKVKADSGRKRDILASTGNLQFKTSSPETCKGTVIIEAERGEPTYYCDLNDTALGQLCSKAAIPLPYARRMMHGYSELFDKTVNAIWSNEPKDILLRTYAAPYVAMRGHGYHLTGRAMLSSAYKTYDDAHLLAAVLPVLMEQEAEANWQIVSADITEQRLFIRFRSLMIESEGVAVGDVVAHGLAISNSETGCGAVSMGEILWTLACLNGMKTERRHRQAHLTGARDLGADQYALLTEETKEADNKALSLKLRDLAGAFTDRTTFDATVQTLRDAGRDMVTSGSGAVHAVATQLKLSKPEEAMVLDGLLETLAQPGYRTGTTSRATLVQAVTAAAKADVADMQDVWAGRGFDVLTLPRSAWSRVADAPAQAVAA